MENGLQARKMSIRDGFALQLAVKCGYRVIIVSGSSPSPVVDRLNKLGITEIHMSVLDKKAFINALLTRLEIRKEEVLYMGDDLPDLPAMDSVGLSACPADAAIEIKEVAKYVSPVIGGAGCVRDVIEIVLKGNGDWNYHPEIASR
jgi:3-deoxy-D-manno-octulosonate 8-phosphate phosphatase (KDO 8-P phosphatase)